MKNINLRNSLFLLIGISAGIFFALVKIQQVPELNVINIAKLIPQIVTFDLILIWCFSSFWWKYRIFKGWLVPFPNLNGTWKGFIQTTWVDPITNSRPDPIPAILTIKQSFFTISCVMRTAEMTSRSITSSFILDKDSQRKQLLYSYDSNPAQTVKERSPQHYGTMIFDIIETPTKKLKGEYWAGRKTTGQIEMSFWKSERLDFYPEELGGHPVSLIRENKG